MPLLLWHADGGPYCIKMISKRQGLVLDQDAMIMLFMKAIKDDRTHGASRNYASDNRLFSEVIGTMAGFGSSTIYLPLASYFVDFRTALVLVAIFHLFGNVGRITFFRHGLDNRKIGRRYTNKGKERKKRTRPSWPLVIFSIFYITLPNASTEQPRLFAASIAAFAPDTSPSSACCT